MSLLDRHIFVRPDGDAGSDGHKKDMPLTRFWLLNRLRRFTIVPL